MPVRLCARRTFEGSAFSLPARAARLSGPPNPAWTLPPAVCVVQLEPWRWTFLLVSGLLPPSRGWNVCCRGWPRAHIDGSQDEAGKQEQGRAQDAPVGGRQWGKGAPGRDRKSTRLNSSH